MTTYLVRMRDGRNERVVAAKWIFNGCILEFYNDKGEAIAGFTQATDVITLPTIKEGICQSPPEEGKS